MEDQSETIATDKGTLLVTGGAGYIGSILVRRLLAKGFRVVCIDNLRYGGHSLVEVWGHPQFDFKKIDITQFENLGSLFEKYAFFAVIHLAAIVGDPACKLEPELARKTNWEASVHLLEKAIQSRTKRFVFASTCSNYGKMEDPSGYVDETSPLAPVSLYAELKVEFEQYFLQKMEKVEGFSPTALRFSTVYGISPRMRFDLTVNEFTKEIALGRKLVVFGEQFWRPYCHVGDFARAILAVLDAPQEIVAYNVFNVGATSQNYTKKMLVEELYKIAPDAQIEFVHRDEDPRDYRVSFEKIHRELGFSISRTVPDGIREIFTSIKMGIIENPDDQSYYNIPVA